MVTIFECKEAECPNKDVVYRMIDANDIAMCGGCGVTLTGSPEQEEENNG